MQATNSTPYLGTRATSTDMGHVSCHHPVGCKQFPDASDNHLAELAQIQLFTLFLAALMLQVDIESNVKDFDKVRAT